MFVPRVAHYIHALKHHVLPYIPLVCTPCECTLCTTIQWFEGRRAIYPAQLHMPLTHVIQIQTKNGSHTSSIECVQFCPHVCYVLFSPDCDKTAQLPSSVHSCHGSACGCQKSSKAAGSKEQQWPWRQN